MSGGLIGLFGFGSPNEPTPTEMGFIDVMFGLAIQSSEIGVTQVREDRTDNRIYLRTERLAHTTAAPGDITWSKVAAKEGWLLCDGVSTIGESGATYSGEAYLDLYNAIKVSQVWGTDLITLPASSISGLTQHIKT